MKQFDVAIVGGGPAGSSCAAFCARAGLQTLLLEREKFPREKVCGDCLNPSCWPVLERLDIAQRVRELPHGKLEQVEFVAIDGRKVTVNLPTGDAPEAGEFSVKRSLFDHLLLRRAGELGAFICDGVTVTTLMPEPMTSVNRACHSGAPAYWTVQTSAGEQLGARFVVGADGRNSTVARLCNLLPPPARERVALQAHIPLPQDFGNRVVLQFLTEGYSGQAPVNGTELNVCLVGTPPTLARLRHWAERHFELAADQPWRTITPLTRAPVPCAQRNLLFIGDAARVVEPFTGEGIYYAIRSGELAANAIAKIIRSHEGQSVLREFARACAEMYRGRLWINRLARASVVWPRFGSLFVGAARFGPALLKFLTARTTQITT
jgi:flavin-dependent dehydrogenase